MGNGIPKIQVSAITWLFLIHEAALLFIALYAHSVSAGIFFWLGLAFLLSRMESPDFRWTALVCWISVSFAILGYAISPSVPTDLNSLSGNPKMLIGFAFYLVAAVTLLYAFTWSYFSLATDVSKGPEQKVNKR